MAVVLQRQLSFELFRFLKMGDLVTVEPQPNSNLRWRDLLLLWRIGESIEEEIGTECAVAQALATAISLSSSVVNFFFYICKTASSIIIIIISY